MNDVNNFQTIDRLDINDNKFMAFLSYIILLIPILFGKGSRFINFHIQQSLIIINFFFLSVLSAIILIVLFGVLGIMVPYLFDVILYLILIFTIVLFIFGMVNSATGKMNNLPIIGKYSFLLQNDPFSDGIQERNIFLIYFLSIFTIGYYSLYWVVYTREDMIRLGAEIPKPWLIIIPIANIYFIYKYCDGFSRYVKKDNNGILWFILYLFVGFIMPAIIQSELNKLSKHH
jgi:uncharacterized membrane protein